VISHFNNISKFKRIQAANLVFFLLWPLATLLVNLKNRDFFEKKSIFLLFLTFFGFVFIYDDPNKVTSGSDSGRWAAEFIYTAEQNIGLSDVFSQLYKAEGGLVDIYSSFFIWLISRFTGDPRYFFMFISFVFSWFFINNVSIVINSGAYSLNKNNILFKLLIAALILLIPSWFINSFRFWTASHVFIFGILNLFLLKKRKGLYFIIGSAFIHFSFIYLIILFVIYRYIPKLNFKLLFWAFIVTSLTNEFRVTITGIVSPDFLPGFLSNRYEMYSNPNYIKILSERSFSWHVTYARSIGKYLPLILLAMLFFSGIYTKSNKFDLSQLQYKTLSVLLFALFAGTTTNIIGGVAELGRFHILFRFLFYAVFITNFQILKQYNKFLNYLLIPLFLFYLIFQIRVGTDYYGIWVFIGNPFLAAVVETQTPIIDFVKEFLK
jgi:hypothetical protein